MVAETLADFTEANFQDFALGLQKENNISVHVFDEWNRFCGTKKFQCKAQFCQDILAYINKVNAALNKIDPRFRNFLQATKVFFSEHPAK